MAGDLDRLVERLTTNAKALQRNASVADAYEAEIMDAHAELFTEAAATITRLREALEQAEQACLTSKGYPTLQSEEVGRIVRQALGGEHG